MINILIDSDHRKIPEASIKSRAVLKRKKKKKTRLHRILPRNPQGLNTVVHEDGIRKHQSPLIPRRDARFCKGQLLKTNPPREDETNLFHCEINTVFTMSS